MSAPAPANSRLSAAALSAARYAPLLEPSGMGSFRRIRRSTIPQPLNGAVALLFGCLPAFGERRECEHRDAVSADCVDHALARHTAWPRIGLRIHVQSAVGEPQHQLAGRGRAGLLRRCRRGISWHH